jgi:hypothetical protein
MSIRLRQLSSPLTTCHADPAIMPNCATSLDQGNPRGLKRSEILSGQKPTEVIASPSQPLKPNARTRLHFPFAAVRASVQSDTVIPAIQIDNRVGRSQKPFSRRRASFTHQGGRLSIARRRMNTVDN